MARTVRRSEQLPLVFSPRSEPLTIEETFEDALEATFPLDPLSDENLYREFCRLFPF